MAILPLSAMCFMALRVLFMQLLWMFMLFALHLAANRTAFSSILPCV